MTSMTATVKVWVRNGGKGSQIRPPGPTKRRAEEDDVTIKAKDLRMSHGQDSEKNNMGRNALIDSVGYLVSEY